MVVRRDCEGAHQECANPPTLVVVTDDERYLGQRWVILVAYEARVGNDGCIGPVGHHPDEMVDIVDLEEVPHQRVSWILWGLEPAVQRLAGELDGPVRRAFAVAG